MAQAQAHPFSFTSDLFSIAFAFTSLIFSHSPIAGVFSAKVADSISSDFFFNWRLHSSISVSTWQYCSILSCFDDQMTNCIRLLIMGRKTGTLFINPKRFGSLHKPCMKEMAMLLNCMAANHSDMEACARQKELLNACMESQSKKNRKSWGSINYQLQRLSRGRK
ncbi:hypothetical protein VNO80_10622 [Phaseolus coccineus]|uniref:IMS import disulfide relay-system CHCH-CHCH-like Cx9C domain-containing protein n=1 Tax=Phaseolus coccineus TaxID=3886 RepID=A0AAN9N8H7_PHACN